MADEGSPCSVVLEGGVTSAVVYASLLASLSRRYTFRRLGGTSSGAVAAAAAAAAEFARQGASGQAVPSFDLLGRFPRVLAGPAAAGGTTLLNLFRPTARTRAGLNVALAALDKSGRDGYSTAAGRVGAALVSNFPAASFLLALAVVLVGLALADGLWARYACAPLPSPQIVFCGASWLLLLLPTVLAAVVGLVVWALWATLRGLRANHWGLCSGMGANDADTTALTPTLYGFFQALAGQGLERPLTFGDLWGPAPAERRIDLQIITTAVNQARPVRLPGEPGADPLHAYFYDPQEWQALFPQPVMAHLAAHRRPVTLRHDDGRELLALPAPAHWPVVMAARFSLSFPLLLSAVPMYIAVPRRALLRAGMVEPPPFEARKVYFSDGGITSNCPVHLFDAPLPAHPSFGVNLYALPEGRRTRVSRSDTQDPELDADATPDASAWTSPLPFLLALLDATLSWRDSLQRSLPGYRERIVHVGLPPSAGGLNLAMSPRTIRRLGRVGLVAAARLKRDFATPRRSGEANAWERHRWTRARSTLSALHAYLAAFAGRLPVGSPDYGRLLRTATPAQFPFQGEAARQQALDLAEGSAELLRAVNATPPPGAMDANTPQPAPVLHMSPPW